MASSIPPTDGSRSVQEADTAEMATAQISTVDVRTLRSPADLVEAAASVLGGEPADSLVALVFRKRRLLYVARARLVEPLVLVRIICTLVDPIVRRGGTGVAFIGYGSARRLDPVMPAVRARATWLRLRIRDVLRVDGGRWWSLLCDNPGCCPPEGTPIAPATRGTSAAPTRPPVTGADRSDRGQERR